MKKYFTSESVTCGHPDKVCDQIADKILDEILLQDSNARVACEVTCTTNQVHIFGEVTTTAKVDYVAVTKEVINEIGYTAINRGFDATNCQIIVDLDEQSPDIALGVNRCYLSEELDNGAGDQGMMFGYACCQTQHYMPLPIELAHALAKRLELVRKTGELAYLLPDGKTQVTVEYENNQPLRISTVVVSSQHREDVDIATLREDITSHVILPTLPQDMLDHQTQIFINPTGRFVVGGPAGDSGLTGRKLIVDSYGGYARHGGGAFSGKDATKVDRSGAYMARYIAKNIVASGLAEECEVQLSYAIGLAQPVSLYIDTYQSEKVPQSEIYQTILNLVDLRPAAIIKRFQLNQPIYSKVACYGHFGNNASAMPWEQTDLVKPLQKLLNKR
ncbi:MAG: methionine adenosyltransferase [Coprobacillus cateniformis]|uniref:methionine adenosyltransferase n=1 Tax=Longibaculum muris TaxID=1796628 RepID=UPI003AB5DE62|nr:methionine adenosyltransferase [Coprobacillus cateniformis]